MEVIRGKFRLAAEKIWLQAAVSVLVRPQCQWNRREIVHNRHCTPVLCEVDCSNIELARFASLHANVRELLRDVDRKFALFDFAASGAQDAPEIPLVSAKRTHHGALSPVAFDSQHPEQWPRLTKRTHQRRC